MPEIITEVDGEPAVVIDGTVDDAPPLVVVSIEELVHTFAVKRRKLREAKSAYSAAGSRVKTIADECEAIASELARRDEIADEPELPFDDEAEFEDNDG